MLVENEVLSTSAQPTGTNQKISATRAPSSCGLDPIEIPSKPAVIPRYGELDEETGLHVTGNYQIIDLYSYRLKITGLVDNPMELTFEELRCMPKVTSTARLICPGFFEDESTWTGVPIAHIFNLAQIQESATKVKLISADGYQAEIPIEEALLENNFLAYEMLGKPLPILHGFPIRAVFPNIIGGKWVKWLIEVRIQ